MGEGASERKYDVCVVGGCGHVGLPLAIMFANAGLTVVIHDTDDEAVRTVASGRMPFMESGAQEILERVLDRNLVVRDDVSLISCSSHVVVVIGTPMDEHLNPDFAGMRDFLGGIIEYLRDGQHLVLRDTVYPGTTEMVRRILEDSGKDVFLSFCPERIAQGNAIEELALLPQIVSGFDARSVAHARTLFSVITDDIVELEPMEAELAKLFTNAWRYVQFATANQFLMIASRYDLDFYRIFDAMRFKYPRTAGFPGAGFSAGPCLLKDTMQLAAFYKNNFFLGHSAMLVNEGLPGFVVERVRDRYDPLSEKVVGVLGMAFKADSDDERESLAYKLRKILALEASEVLCTDPYVDDPRLSPLGEVLERSDVLILACPHGEYRDLDLGETPVVDIWDFYGRGAGL